MRVGAVAVGQFEAVVEPAQFRAEGRDAGHRGVHMQPQPLAARDLADRPHRVDGQRVRGTDGRAHPERHQARGPVGGDRRGEGIRAHRKVLVVPNHAQVAGADAGDP